MAAWERAVGGSRGRDRTPDLAGGVSQAACVLPAGPLSHPAPYIGVWDPDMETTSRPITILMAEGNPADQSLARRAFEQCHLAEGLRLVGDGAELLDYLYRRGKYADPATAPRPAMILLELKMPGSDGREALETIKRDAHLRRIPVVVLTAYRRAEDIVRSYDLGANSFITKPITYQGLVDTIQVFRRYWFEIADLPTGAGA